MPLVLDFMNSAVAVLTFNRIVALQELMRGLQTHCSHYQTAVFEDKGLWDGTARWLTRGQDGFYDHERLAYEYPVNDKNFFEAFLGTRNLGVAGNSNRALSWFMQRTNADHLCLMNDDLHVDGDFAKVYAQAHEDTGIQLFCNCTFTSEQYRWTSFKLSTPSGRDYTIKLLPRMTGIMMSITRKLVEKIGYYDVSFGPFGQEHCDYNNRARFSGCIQIQGQDLHCIDVEEPAVSLRHQEVPTSMSGEDRQLADIKAERALVRASRRYPVTDHYRPFRLVHIPVAGAYEDVGINTEEMVGYGLVINPTNATY
jgi:hypothetical protein